MTKVILKYLFLNEIFFKLFKNPVFLIANKKYDKEVEEISRMEKEQSHKLARL